MLLVQQEASLPRCVPFPALKQLSRRSTICARGLAMQIQWKQSRLFIGGPAV